MRDEVSCLSQLSEIHLKAIVIGDYGVGKTSLCRRYATGMFEEDYKPTIGVDVYTKTLEIPDFGIIRLQIWDTAGEERFKRIYPRYWLGARIVLVVFDITSRKTFESVDEWIENARTHLKDAQIVLIGNKKDLEPYREVDEEKGRKKAEELSLLGYIETSAKTGENVDKAFKMAIDKILEKMTR